MDTTQLWHRTQDCGAAYGSRLPQGQPPRVADGTAGYGSHPQTSFQDLVTHSADCCTGGTGSMSVDEPCSTASQAAYNSRRRGAGGDKENGCSSLEAGQAPVPDKRKERRRTSNRDCARRIRERRAALLAALADKVAGLRLDHDKLAAQLQEVTDCWQEISSINSTLRQKLVEVADGVPDTIIMAIVQKLGAQEANAALSTADLQQLEGLLHTLPASQQTQREAHQQGDSSMRDPTAEFDEDLCGGALHAPDEYPSSLFGFADELQSQSQAFLAERRLRMEPAAASCNVSPAAALKTKPAALDVSRPMPMASLAPESPLIDLPDMPAFPLLSPGLGDLPALPSPLGMSHAEWLPEDFEVHN